MPGIMVRIGNGSVTLFAALMATFFLLFAGAATAQADMAVQASGYKMAGDSNRTRIVLNFDREPTLKWFMLRSPNRLVIDLSRSDFAVEAAELRPRGIVSDVQLGNLSDDVSRLLLTAKTPFLVEKLDVVKNETSLGYRLVADLVSASQRQFDQALADQVQITGSTVAAKGDRLGLTGQPSARKPFTIVIDAGHGGIDGGAEGVGGAVEKDITLSFAQELKTKLETLPDFRVFMTRNNDAFLRLDERVMIARQHEADLLLSIHADTIRQKGVRGATVYTVSDKASDAEAAALAVRENLSDKLAGIEVPDENHEVADILADLIRRETHAFSVQFARSLIGELQPKIELINNPHRSAGFRVLKAPDVPSVLLELGYLSNPEDEAQLKSTEWRAMAADRISAAIAQFAPAKVGQR